MLGRGSETVGPVAAVEHTDHVVATLSFNAKMDLANLGCNLKTRDSQKWPVRGDLSIVGTLSERT